MDFEFTQEEFNHPWKTRWCSPSYSLWYFHPETWGRWTHFDFCRICFQLRAFNSKQVMAWRGAQLFDAGLSGSSQKNVVGNTPPMPTPGGNEAILRDYISHQGGWQVIRKGRWRGGFLHWLAWLCIFDAGKRECICGTFYNHAKWAIRHYHQLQGWKKSSFPIYFRPSIGSHGRVAKIDDYEGDQSHVVFNPITTLQRASPTWIVRQHV